MTMKYCIKCAIVGDAGVGKTSLAVTQATGEIPDRVELIGSVFENYAVEMKVRKTSYTLGMFDISSDDNYEPLRAFAYERSDIFLLCFSVVRRDSFENVQRKWLPETKKYIQKKKPLFVVGLQTDLRSSPGVTDFVSHIEGRELADKLGASGYKECSRLSVKDVWAVFNAVLHEGMTNKKKSKFSLFSRKVSRDSFCHECNEATTFCFGSLVKSKK